MARRVRGDPLTFFDGEPEAGPWSGVTAGRLAACLLHADPGARALPRIIAIDGCGGAGKSTLAGQLWASTPGSTVVHTDDIAWHHSLFDWSEVLAREILEPVRAGQAVSFRPRPWRARGREGAIAVPSGRRAVWLEGTGAAQRGLTQWLDAVVWIQADLTASASTCVTREGGTQAAVERSHEWQAAEAAFFTADRPWQRAGLVIAGTGLRVSAAEERVFAAPGPLIGSATARSPRSRP